MNRRVFFPLALAVPAALIAAGDARAQRDERLFLVYALEDLHRSTWPVTEDGHCARSSSQMRARLARQRKLADQLRLHAEARRYDPELLDMYEEYRKLLTFSEPFAQQLEEREKPFREFLEALRKKYATIDLLRRMAASADAADTALEASIDRFGDFDPFGGLIAGFTRAMMNEAALSIRRAQDRAAFQRELDAYLRSTKAQFDAEVKGDNKKFLAEFSRERAARLAATRKALRELAGRHNWSADEAEFDPARPLANWDKEKRPRDPFRAFQLYRETPPPKDRAGEQASLDCAKECLAAVKLVPPGTAKATSEVFRDYAATLCALAGNEALAAAASQIGAAGFQGAAAKPAPAATTAIFAWEQYRTYEPEVRDRRGAVLHKQVLALAYAGRTEEAYKLAFKASKTTKENAEFWYDSARLCSLTKHWEYGWNCLELARKYGFREVEKARESDDLKALRLKDSARFDRILADP